MHIVILIVVLAVLERSIAKPVTERLVHVHTEIPSYIEFTFETNGDAFEPISLWAKSSSTNDIEFVSTRDRNHKTFRNLLPQNFIQNEVITLELEYIQKTNRRSRNEVERAIFQYDVKKKPSNFLLTSSDADVPDYLQNINHDELTTESSAKSYETEPTELAKPPSDYELELFKTALGEGHFTTRLLLKNKHSLLESNAVEAIRNFIIEKLFLPHLEYNILQAQFRDDGLLFEMATPKDVIEILTQARLRLEHSPYKIISTQRHFYDTRKDEKPYWD